MEYIEGVCVALDVENGREVARCWEPIFAHCSEGLEEVYIEYYENHVKPLLLLHRIDVTEEDHRE